MGYNILLFTDLLDDKNSGGQFQLYKLAPQALAYNTTILPWKSKGSTCLL